MGGLRDKRTGADHKIRGHSVRVISRIVVERQIANVVPGFFKGPAQDPVNGRNTAKKAKTVLGDNNIFNLHKILPFRQRIIEVSE